MYAPVQHDVQLRLEVYKRFFADGQSGGRISARFIEHGIDQSGAGFGSNLAAFFSRLFVPALRALKPVAVSGGKAIVNQALNSAGGYLGDLASGMNWKQAASTRAQEAEKALIEKVRNKFNKMQSGSGGGVKRLYSSHLMPGPEEPMVKIQRISALKDKNRARELKAYSICAPPDRDGSTHRDLRYTKQLVKNKFAQATARRVTRSSAGKKKQQSGKGIYDGWL